MGNFKLKGKDLRAISFPKDKVKSMALTVMNKHYKHHSKSEKIEVLESLLANPESFIGHVFLDQIAQELIEKEKAKTFDAFELKDQPKNYPIYGKPFIDSNTIKQMDLAMKLPVAEAGALMPDAHVGYGLPIGGVLATQNEVIPYGVGLDIGCRMSLTVYDIPVSEMDRNAFQYKKALKEETFFGVGKLSDFDGEHAVLDDSRFQETQLLKQLQGKAVSQIGSSGSGNHFVEFGRVELNANNALGMEAGNYVGILAHSGSRGVGATIAQYYTQVAMDKCKLPKGAQHLAWLDLNTEAGMEYWIAMNLAGDYAKACHDVIHQRLAKALGLKPVLKVENHHNFAWKEKQENGQDWVVHRKGSTPAAVGQLGIIPGSMSAPGYIVSGKGKATSLHSASHGAGRKMSRKKTKEAYTKSAMNKGLKRENIELIGGGVDEAPIAYKDIEKVMEYQNELVNIEGKFFPRIVRMDKP